MNLRNVSTAACWVAILASFVLSFSTWLALGIVAGFGLLAAALPFCVDGYVVTALTTWLMPGVSDKLARFARTNLYAVGALGMLAQASYHAWLAYPSGAVGLPGKTLLAFAVGLFPMAISTLAVHLRTRAVRELDVIESPQLPAEQAPQQPPATELPTPERTRPSISVQAASELDAPTPLPAALHWVPSVQQKAAPRPKVEASGSGPRPKATGVDDVRRLLDAGLGRYEIKDQLGLSLRTVDRRLADIRAKDPAVAS